MSDAELRAARDDLERFMNDAWEQESALLLPTIPALVWPASQSLEIRSGPFVRGEIQSSAGSESLLRLARVDRDDSTYGWLWDLYDEVQWLTRELREHGAETQTHLDAEKADETMTGVSR